MEAPSSDITDQHKPFEGVHLSPISGSMLVEAPLGTSSDEKAGASTKGAYRVYRPELSVHKVLNLSGSSFLWGSSHIAPSPGLRISK